MNSPRNGVPGIRRLAHACAALFAALIVVVGPGVPAHADPPPDGQCTPAEWLDPRKYADCARRLGSAAAQRAQCIKAPEPSSPNAGIASWLTTRPDADLRSGVRDRYTRYGVGGYRLEMYDVSCAGPVLHPEANFENSIASLEFAMAAAVIGGANTLREHAYSPGDMWAWSDQYVSDLVDAAYRDLFLTFGVLGVAAAGLWLMARAARGRLSEAARIFGWSLAVIVVTTAVFRWPVASAHGFDMVGTHGLAAVHSVLGPGPRDIPLEKCRVYELSPEACKDNRTVAGRASDAVTEAILYKSWLRAVLGSADSPTATKYGPALFDATTYTWQEAADIEASPALRQQIIDRKGQQWLAVAEQIKAEDPEAYAHLQGLRGTDRVGSGLVALLSAIIFALFDVTASFMVLLGFAIARFVVILLPVVATWGVMQPASQSLRWLADTTVRALLNIVRFGAQAGLFLWVTVTVFDSTLSGAVQVLIVLLAGVASWLLLRPLKLLTGRRTAESDGDGKSSGRASWVWSAAAAAAGAAARAAADDGPVRAEATVGRPRRPETRALPPGSAR